MGILSREIMQTEDETVGYNCFALRRANEALLWIIDETFNLLCFINIDISDSSQCHFNISLILSNFATRVGRKVFFQNYNYLKYAADGFLRKN